MKNRLIGGFFVSMRVGNMTLNIIFVYVFKNSIFFDFRGCIGWL